ncbi:MAG: hypothetical protein AAGP08_13520, partial [Pseudomonadota bacterium]
GLGAVLGIFAAALVAAVILIPLYLTGFVEGVFLWANRGFYDLTQPTFQRYSYLLIAGIPYGMSFGASFGALIAVTRIFTDRAAETREQHATA